MKVYIGLDVHGKQTVYVGVAAFQGYPIPVAGIAGFVAWISLLPSGEIALGPVGLSRGPHETGRTGQTPTSGVLKLCFSPAVAGERCSRTPRTRLRTV